MDEKNLENIITRLEIVQIKLQAKRRDHNGNILQKDDIEAINVVIEIIKNLIIDEDYIWQNKNIK
jgi:hypothetical protein